MGKALFMDLQGTLGGDPFGDISSFTFYEGVIKALHMASKHGYQLFVLTNQSRISKGHLGMEAYQDKEKQLKKALEKEGVDLVFYCCPHQEIDSCRCRKPSTYFIEVAKEEYNIALNSSYVIGDMGKSDMVMAARAGVKSVLVMTGAGASSLGEYRHTWPGTKPSFISENIYEGIKRIIKEESLRNSSR